MLRSPVWMQPWILTRESPLILGHSVRFVIDSAIVKYLSGISLLLMLFAGHGGTLSQQSEAPTLTGRWILEFSLRSGTHRFQFDAQASGEGTLLNVDPDLIPAPAPQKAVWALKGQSSSIYSFTISGDAVFAAAGGSEAGRLEFTGSSELNLPVVLLRGWVQMHSTSSPADGRGSEDPVFDFTARRIEGLSIQVTSPGSGERLRRGKAANIEWAVKNYIEIASQKILISLDGGESFIEIAGSIPGDARSFEWVLPEHLPKTKKAIIKVEITETGGVVAEGFSAGKVRIK
jgi:hypothetical protein